jgi:hypothetical protein
MLSVFIFVFHFACLYVILLIRGGEPSVFYERSTKEGFSIVGLMIYASVIAYWAYFVISFIYVMIIRNNRTLLFSLIIAFLLMTIAYTLFRAGDIIDGDFIKNFDILHLAVIILSAPIMVLAERWFSGMLTKPTIK